MDLNDNLLTQLQADILAADPKDIDFADMVLGEVEVRALTEYERKFFALICVRAKEIVALQKVVAEEPCTHADNEPCPGAEKLARLIAHHDAHKALFWTTVKEAQGIWAFKAFGVRKGNIIVTLAPKKDGIDAFFDFVDALRDANTH